MKHLHHNLLLESAASNEPDVTESWLQNLLAQNSSLNVELIRQTLHLLTIVGKDKLNPYGDSCLAQGLAMADIINELGVDTDTLAACILYGCVQFGDLLAENISEHLGNKIAKLIIGTKQLDGIDDFYSAVAQGEQYHSNLDNIRKMFLAMVDDARVVIIKLVERLYILQRIAKFNDDRKTQIAKSVAAVYAPLANRLGISHLKWEMEDLSFRYLEPEKYYQISKALKEKRVARETYIENVIDTLEGVMAAAQLEGVSVTGRVKHIYSIYKKMCRKNVGVEHIYDVNAVRIFVTNVIDCYTALSAVNNKWQLIPEEFDDYIAHPKPNGYRSIHTAVYGPENKIVEIQIRTYAMHEEAELGVAAHWIYKEGAVIKHGKSDYESKIAWLRQVMSWQEEVVGNEEKQKGIRDVFCDRIYVFTPQNDILDLPQGATPLDFAYRLHTEVGNRCVGAKINGAIVQLNHQLQTGDKVEILTAKHGKPRRDWLNQESGYLITAHARAKAFAWFKKQSYDENVMLGQQVWDKEQKKLGIKFPSLEHAAVKLHYKSKADFLAGLARGEVKTAAILAVFGMDMQISHNKDPEDVKEILRNQHAHAKSSNTHASEMTGIKILGIDNLLTHIANCCKPVPGDRIVGYITQGRGVSIHREDCCNVSLAKDDQIARLIEVNWIETNDKRYWVDVVVEAFDRNGLARDITSVFADEEVVLNGLRFVVDKKEQIAQIYITMQIEDLKQLNKVLGRMTLVPNVIKAWRKS